MPLIVAVTLPESYIVEGFSSQSTHSPFSFHIAQYVVLTVFDCSLPEMVTLPVALVAGVPTLLCSLPLNVTEPLPGCDTAGGMLWRAPVMLMEPLDFAPAEPPPGSSTSINWPSALVMLLR